MANELRGKRVAFLAAEMFEQVELTEPWKAVEQAGGKPELVSLEDLPGGVGNPDQLRADENAVRFVTEFFEAGKPVAAICHAPWTLIEAGVVRGRKLISYPSIQTDVRKAGGDWVDEEVVVDNGLVTSRSPDKLPAFNRKLVEEFAEGVHEGQRDAAKASP